MTERRTGTSSPPAPGAHSLAEVLAPLVGASPRRLPLAIHELLREQILQRRLEPASTLKQAEVARLLGVSRTPIREAFRMLQEEGLITTEPDQRAIVVGLDVADLDAAYASRILLESLAAAITAASITPAALAALDEALARMHHLHDQHWTSRDWAEAHLDFHRTAASGASPHLRKEVEKLTDRTHHYFRLAQLGNVGDWSAAEAAHRAILEAMATHAPVAAGEAMARHLATTARNVMAQIDPGQDLPAISTAVAMVSHQGV